MVLQLKLNSFFPLDLFVQHFNHFQTRMAEHHSKKWNDRPTLWHIDSYLSTPTATLLQQTPQLPCWNPSWASLAVSFPGIGPLLHGSPSFWESSGMVRISFHANNVGRLTGKYININSIWNIWRCFPGLIGCDLFYTLVGRQSQNSQLFVRKPSKDLTSTLFKIARKFLAIHMIPRRFHF